MASRFVRGCVVLLSFVAFVAVGVVGYDCAGNVNSRLITRHWVLKPGATFSSPDVVSTFQTGFGPSVRALPGFVEYIGASIVSVTNTTTTYTTGSEQFFMNIFDTKANAQTAQNAAAGFVTNGVLNAQIMRYLFLQSNVSFLLTPDQNCLATTFGSYHLATRYWQLKPNATYSIAQVANEFKVGFGPTISAQSGFVAYAGAVVDDDTFQYNFFFNIFTTTAGAANANTLAASFVANGVLSGQITRVLFTESDIGFDLKPSSSAVSWQWSFWTVSVLVFAVCSPFTFNLH